jgi:flavin-dependent dehydrogenase
VRYDVIIVGSGPSGASTALNLARICPGIAERTLVLERDRHPRHKLCGGGCVPQVDMCLERLGLDYREVPRVDVDWAWLHFRGRGFPLRFAKDYSFRVVRRNEFDAWLADHVRRRGIEIMEETRVTKLVRTPEGVEVETNRGTFSARVVVGADGTSGVVRKLVPEGERSCTVARLVELVTPAEPAGSKNIAAPGGATLRIDGPSGPSALAPNDALLDFAFMPTGVQGYVWSFPTKIAGERMRNWGVYDSRLIPRKSAGSLRPVVAEWLAQAGYRLDDYHLEGHPIRLFERRANFAAPGVVLVGDAAGVDATFGEGISPALAYGEIAARAIDDAFRRGDFSFAGYRAAVLRSPVGVALRRRTFAARALNRLPYPWVQKLLWWRMAPVARWYIKNVLFSWGVPPEPLPSERPSAPVPAPHAPAQPAEARQLQ